VITWTKPSADLSLTNTGSPSTVVSGTRLTYTVTVTNGGGDSATDVRMTDVLPASGHLVSMAATQGSCTRTPNGAPVTKDGAIVCNLGTVTAGSSVMITIVVRATTPGPISALASVTASNVTEVGDVSQTATNTVIRR
jgi:uncharacterized repeat protein (TIGR01451 family)